MAHRARTLKASLYASTALRAAALIVLAGPAGAQVAASARPAGGQVSSGLASIGGNATTTTINQASQNAVINWQSYNIGAGQTVQYTQPNSASFTLNRVITPQPSQIAGHITANGRIAIVNQSGVVFLHGSTVDTAGLVVSAAGISDQDFMAGRLVFGAPARPGASVSNAGSITIRQAGLAALVAPQVANSGVITAQLGRVILGGATTHTLDLYGDGLVALNVTKQVTSVDVGGHAVPALVTNTGTILAPGGTVVLTAQAADGVVSTAVSAGGVISAPTVGAQTGRVLVSGIGGDVEVDGAVSASGAGTGGAGGQVEVNGNRGVILAAGSLIDASGDAGGGVAAVGTTVARAIGGSRVHAAMTASHTTIAAGAAVRADAIRFGKGGRVTALSTGVTTNAGSVSARGGATGGSGGWVEVSGYTLAFGGSVNVTAPRGAAGTLYLDPQDIVIETTGTSSGNTTVLTPDTFRSFMGDVIIKADGTLKILNDVTANAMAKSLELEGDQGITIDARLNAPNIPVLLYSLSGDITVAGQVTAGSISAFSGGSIALSSATNMFGSVGPFDTLNSTSLSGTTVTDTYSGQPQAGMMVAGATASSSILLDDSGGLSVATLIQSVHDGISIASKGGGLSLRGTLQADSSGMPDETGAARIDLLATGGGISQSASGLIITPTLTVSAVAPPGDRNSYAVDLAGANQIAVLAGGSATGDFTLADASALEIAGNVTAGASGPSTLTLRTTNAAKTALRIDQLVTLGALGGSVVLQADSFLLAGTIDAPGGLLAIDRTDSGTLALGGPLDSFSGAGLGRILVQTLALGSTDGVNEGKTSTLLLDSALPSAFAQEGGTLGLFSTGDITATAAIVTPVLYGEAGGAIALNSQNTIGTIAGLGAARGLTAGAGLSLTDSTSLIVAAAAVQAGGDLSIKTGGDLVEDSKSLVASNGGDIALTASGTLTLASTVATPFTATLLAQAGNITQTASGGASATGTLIAGSLAAQAGAFEGATAYDVLLNSASANRIGTLTGIATAGGPISSATGTFSLNDGTGLVIAAGAKIEAGNTAAAPAALDLLVATAQAGDLTIDGILQAGNLVNLAPGVAQYAGSLVLTHAGSSGSITEAASGQLRGFSLNANALAGEVLLSGALNVVEHFVGSNEALGRFDLADSAMLPGGTLPMQNVFIDAGAAIRASAIDIQVAGGNLNLETASGLPGALIAGASTVSLAADLGVLQFGGAISGNEIVITAGAEFAQFAGASITGLPLSLAGTIEAPSVGITAGTRYAAAGFANDIILADSHTITLNGIALGGIVSSLAAGGLGSLTLFTPSGDISQAAPTETTTGAPTSSAPAATGTILAGSVAFRAGTVTADPSTTAGTLSNVWLTQGANQIGTLTGIGGLSGAAGAVSIADSTDLALAQDVTLSGNGPITLELAAHTLTQLASATLASAGAITLDAALVSQIDAGLIEAGGNAIIAGSLIQNASVVQAAGMVSQNTTGGLTQTNASTLSGNKGVLLALGGGVAQDPTSLIQSISGNIDIDSTAGDIAILGTVRTGPADFPYPGTVTLDAQQGSITQQQTLFQAFSGPRDGDASSRDGVITGTLLAGTLAAFAAGDITLDNVTNSVAVITQVTTPGGAKLQGLVAGGLLTFADGQALSLQNATLSGLGLDLEMPLAALTQDGGNITATSSYATLNSLSFTQIDGTLNAPLFVQITGGGVSQTGGAIAGSTGVTITLADGLSQDASAISSGAGVVSISNATMLTQTTDSSIAGSRGVQIALAGALMQPAGSSITSADGLVQITTPGAVMLDGTDAGASLGIQAGSLSQAASGTLIALSSLAASGAGTFSFSGLLSAPEILLGIEGGAAPAAIVWNGGSVIETGYGTPGSPQDGLFARAGGFVVGPISVSGPGASRTMQLTLSGRGSNSISFTRLAAPTTQLVLDLGAAGTASGTIDVAGLNVFYTGAGAGGTQHLTGIVDGRTGSAAAASAFIHVTQASNYQLNGCPIQSINCVLLSPLIVPLGSPVRDLEVSVVHRHEEDDDLILPNVAEQDY